MAKINYDAKFWKNEYEQLRRKKNKQLLAERKKLLRFMDITWKLLKELKVPNQVILAYYKNEKEKQDANIKWIHCRSTSRK